MKNMIKFWIYLLTIFQILQVKEMRMTAIVMKALTVVVITETTGPQYVNFTSLHIIKKKKNYLYSPLEGIEVKVNETQPIQKRSVLPVVTFQRVEFLIRRHCYNKKKLIRTSLLIH